MARTRANRVAVAWLFLGLSLAACQSTPRVTPATPPQVSVVSSMLGLGIAAYYPDRRMLYLYSIGPEEHLTVCSSWRLEGPEQWPMPQPCAATAPAPPVRKTVP
jgi:hypothetical protein